MGPRVIDGGLFCYGLAHFKPLGLPALHFGLDCGDFSGTTRIGHCLDFSLLGRQLVFLNTGLP